MQRETANTRDTIQYPTAMRSAFEGALMAAAISSGARSAADLTGVAALVAATPQKTGLKKKPAWSVSRRQERRGAGRGR